MLSVITNIYNKKTKGPRDVRCSMFDVFTTDDTAQIDTIFKFLPHTRQHVDACVALYKCYVLS